MAPGAGLEPATLSLTARCSTIELPRNVNSALEVRLYTKPKLRTTGDIIEVRRRKGQSNNLAFVFGGTICLWIK
jgi:hypothetical protein